MTTYEQELTNRMTNYNRLRDYLSDKIKFTECHLIPIGSYSSYRAIEIENEDKVPIKYVERKDWDNSYFFTVLSQALNKSIFELYEENK